MSADDQNVPVAHDSGAVAAGGDGNMNDLTSLVRFFLFCSFLAGLGVDFRKKSGKKHWLEVGGNLRKKEKNFQTFFQT